MSIVDTLRQFSAFNTLDDGLLGSLGNNIDIKSKPAGETLFSIGDNDLDDFFLVAGTVGLKNKEQKITFIEAGLPNSNRPLSPRRPRLQTATAKTEINYFTINHALVTELINDQKKSQNYSSLQAQSRALDSDGQTLFQQFEHELDRGHFSLPSFPEVALKIRDLVDHPDCNINDLVSLAHSDPGIAAKLIKTANSPLYRGVSPCDNLTTAIMRLGLNTTKQLVTSFAALSLFESESPLLKQQMELLRQKSITVAAHAFVLATEIKHLNAEEALLAGLLYPIGKIIVINYAERFHEFDDNTCLLAAVIHHLRDSVGALAVEQWGFSKQLISVVKESSNNLRAAQQPIDYCDLIISIKQLILMGDDFQTSLNPHTEIPPLQALYNTLGSTKIAASILIKNKNKLLELQRLFLS